MSVYEIERLTLAECVCSRPKMFTATGSLAEVFALLSGHDLAARNGSTPKDTSPSQAVAWLAATCSFKDIEMPSSQISKILQHFGSETKALSSISTFLKSQRDATTKNA